MSVRALFSVTQNVRDLSRSMQFYASLGFVESTGYRLADGAQLPQELEEALGVDLTRRHSALISLPWDPFMHIELVEWANPREGGWPVTYDQLGSPEFSLLVDDINAEVAVFAGRGLSPVVGPIAVERNWGRSDVAVFRDPDGNFVQLIDINYRDAGWDESRRSPMGAPLSFLHFELNTSNMAEMSDFYLPMGFELDPGFQPRSGGAQKSWQGAPIGGTAEPATSKREDLTFNETIRSAQLLRLPTDSLNMHLGLYDVNDLRDPQAWPAWNQRGIVRYAFKSHDQDEQVAELKRRGVPVLIEDYRFAIELGDAQFCYFTDPDGNIVCFEQYHAPRSWGQRF